MGINKSGTDDKKMLIRGGRVETHDGHLIIDSSPEDDSNILIPLGGAPENNNTDQWILDSAQPLVNPPAELGSTELAIPAARSTLTPQPQPPTIYLPDTLGARIKDSFVDGEATLVGMTAGYVGFATYLGLNAYWWIIATAHTLVANAAVILSDCLIALMVLGAVIVLIGQAKRGGRNFVDLKGCMKGTTPGRIRLWLD